MIVRELCFPDASIKVSMNITCAKVSLPTVMPTTSNPTSAQPTTSVPTTFNPTTTDPTTDTPTTDQPTTTRPTLAAGQTNGPTTSMPTTDIPTTDIPTTNEPTTNEPTTKIPTTSEPSTFEPTTDEPTTDEPTIPIDICTFDRTYCSYLYLNPSSIAATQFETEIFGTDDEVDSTFYVYLVNNGSLNCESVEITFEYTIIDYYNDEKYIEITEGDNNTAVGICGKGEAGTSNSCYSSYECITNQALDVGIIMVDQSYPLRIYKSAAVRENCYPDKSIEATITIDCAIASEITTSMPTTFQPTTDQPTTSFPTTSIPTTSNPTTAKPTITSYTTEFLMMTSSMMTSSILSTESLMTDTDEIVKESSGPTTGIPTTSAPATVPETTEELATGIGCMVQIEIIAVMISFIYYIFYAF